MSASCDPGPEPGPRRRRATIALPKRCIFCDVEGKLTREDFFPEWFRKLYPAPAGSRGARLNAEATRPEVDPATGRIVVNIVPTSLARPGDLADQTLRVVCAPCNNGWMSRLQEAARPILTPYILGKWPRPTRAGRAVMSSWAAMFAMVIEFGDEPSAIVPPIEREVFRYDRRPPIGAMVWAGRLAGDLPYWFHRRTLRVTDDSTEIMVVPNGALTTIVLGHLMLQVYLTTSDLEPIDPVERADRLGLTILWPLRETSPRHHRLPTRDADAIRDLAYAPLNAEMRLGVPMPYVRDLTGFGRGARG